MARSSLQTNGAYIVYPDAIEEDTMVWFVYPDVEGDDDDRWRQLLIDVEPFECWFDILSAGYLLISAPAATADAVDRYLNQRENVGDFVYERGDAE